MGFLDELKRRLAQQEGQHPPLVMNDPGISGRDTRPSDVITGVPQQPTPSTAPPVKILTPANQATITRPRSVMDNVRTAVAQPQQQMPQVSSTVDTQPNLRNDTPEATRDRRTQPRDYIADDAAYLRDVRNQPRNWKDKVVDAIDAVNAGVGGQRRILPTKRERQMAEAENRLGTELTTAKTQQALEQGQMVPFQLPNGQWTQIPLKQAATVGSRQQGQQANLSLRKRQLDEHLGRWQSMTKHEAMGDAQRLYNSGAADDNEDLRDEIVRMMGLPAGTKLPPHTMGQIQTDADGNLVVVDRRKSTATPVTAPNAQGVPTPVSSMQGTLEKGRNRRFQQGVASREKIATMPQRPSSTVRNVPKIGEGTKKEIAKGFGEYEQYIGDLKSIDDEIGKANALPANWSQEGETKNDYLARLGQKRTKRVAEIKKRMVELNQLDPENEWGSGEGGYPYRKAKGGAPSDLDQPIVGTPTGGIYTGKRFSRAKIAERAKQLKMTVEQAEKTITDGGGTIY